MTIEVWKAIDAFPDYDVSNLGRVRSRKSGHPQLLKFSVSRGYYIVRLYNGERGRNVKVHKAVIEAFKGPQPSPQHECAHDDGDKLNNRDGNLKWSLHKDNEADKKRHGTDNAGERQGRSKLSERAVLEMRSLHEQGASFASIGRSFGVSDVAARLAIKGATWASVR